jgi:hypothetical protein
VLRCGLRFEDTLIIQSIPSIETTKSIEIMQNMDVLSTDKEKLTAGVFRTPAVVRS